VIDTGYCRQTGNEEEGDGPAGGVFVPPLQHAEEDGTRDGVDEDADGWHFPSRMSSYQLFDADEFRM